MRISNLLWMAIKSLKGKLIVFPVVMIAVGTFCLCFAGTVLATVQQEKSLPYELEVISNTSAMTDSNVAEISRIPDVIAVTPVLEVPVSIEAGEYKAQITLTGIDAAYINDAFDQGGVFADSSVMPYIVLNKAACKLLTASDEKNTDQTDEPQIDWLSTTVTVQTGESSKPVTAKIVGLLSAEDEEQSASAYISVGSAKGLLTRDGLRPVFLSTDVRTKNAGCATAVSKQLTALGLSAVNANEDVELKWEMELKEMAYLIVTGAFGLLCSALLAAARRKLEVLEHKETFAALYGIGMEKNVIQKLFVMQSFITVLFGVSVGMIVGVSVPSFLSPEILDTSIFAMQIPFGVAAVCAAISIVFGMLPFLRPKYLDAI